MGLSELAQRSFANAHLLFEQAVWASEQEKNGHCASERIGIHWRSVQRPAAMVAGHLSRMAKTCAIKFSNIETCMLTYRTLLDLMMRGQKIQEMQTLLQKALQQGIPDILFSEYLRFLEVNAQKT